MLTYEPCSDIPALDLLLTSFVNVHNFYNTMYEALDSVQNGLDSIIENVGCHHLRASYTLYSNRFSAELLSLTNIIPGRCNFLESKCRIARYIPQNSWRLLHDSDCCCCWILVFCSRCRCS
ncbi:hypothetical protein DL98DRAFT_22708 [Cadophora sp. DSE1049]|nr:hypothetical protein DL98DRAFT_22708 [Cadophora sp. DSE1049]